MTTALLTTSKQGLGSFQLHYFFPVLDTEVCCFNFPTVYSAFQALPIGCGRDLVFVFTSVFSSQRVILYMYVSCTVCIESDNSTIFAPTCSHILVSV